ncbi:MAG: hypothetical protein SX243_00585, partial [Acidobacteriota bacterium]|nr:hypothetical protein [Acidobacteriota bacterium]
AAAAVAGVAPSASSNPEPQKEAKKETREAVPEQAQPGLAAEEPSDQEPPQKPASAQDPPSGDPPGDPAGHPAAADTTEPEAPDFDDGDPGPEPPPELLDQSPSRPAPSPRSKPSPPSAAASDREQSAENAERPTPPARRAPSKSSDDGAAIDRFLEAVTTKKQPLGVRLQGAQDLHVENRTLVISVPRDDASWPRALERNSNLKVLEAALRKEWGDGMTWRLHPVDAPAQAETEKVHEAAPDPTVREDPRVQTVLDIFGGRIDSVAPHEDG